MEDTLERWQSEKTAAYLSGAVAAAESDPGKAKLFREMADAAETQAGILAKELKQVPTFEPSLRSRLTASLVGLFGPRAMKPILSASKVRGVSVYSGKLPAGRHITKKLIANPEQALDTLAREELGLNPDDLGSPIGAAISSFIAFCIGASLPLIPFLFGMSNGVTIAALLSGAALFVVGATLSLFSGKGALLGGLRMLLIGAAAAAATYGIGSLFNVGTGGL
jgi:VIT1/CCC1 family predicted Fe2+/Mn2+ transporter